MAEKIICPNCEKEVEIPEENLKQFPCPECFQAVMPPPKPLTKQWIIVAAIAGVLLLIAAAMPVVINMIQASVDKECQKIENDFNAKKKLSAYLFRLGFSYDEIVNAMERFERE